jgi:hypothetical protein
MIDYNVDMFKIPLAHYVVRDWELKKLDLVRLMDECAFSIDRTVKTTYDTTGQTQTDRLNEMFSHVFKEEIELFMNHIQLNYYEITLSWFQVEEPQMCHIVHNHGYGISSICYIEFDPEEHKSVQFLSPFNHILTGNSEHYSPNVSEGSIIFFPSFVNHYTVPNPSKKNRVIASFNMRVDK